MSLKGAGRALQNLLSLLTCLANADSDGRIVISKREEVGDPEGAGESSLRLNYVLLNPSAHFKPIIDQARAVILIGGTMQPFSYARSFLFPDLHVSRLRLFSCGHVVNRNNISAHILSKGVDGVEFDFRHSTRLSRPLVQSLKVTIR